MTLKAFKESVIKSLLNNKELQFVFVGGKGGVGKTTCSSAVDGLVLVGAGGDVGQDEFMRWQDPDHHVASYVGVMTGWGATGEWEVCAAGWGARMLDRGHLAIVALSWR